MVARKTLVTVKGVKFPEDDFDFNWVKLAFVWQIAGNDDEAGADVEIRVPKSIADVGQIKSYAIGRAVTLLSGASSAIVVSGIKAFEDKYVDEDGQGLDQ